LKLSRRELAGLLGAAALGVRRVGAEPAPSIASPGVGRVGVAVAPAGELEPAAARQAVAVAVAAATGLDDGAQAVARLFSARDTVGLKLSCLGGRSLSPRVEVVEALVDLLWEAGVPRDRIIVFERSGRELSRAGFTLRERGGPYRCVGVDGDWDREITVSGEIGSCFARLVSSTCTALISVAVVKDHDLAGVSGTLKNFYGVIHNPNKYHDHGCDPYVADVVRHSYVAGKLRLSLLDGGLAQCHGGPAYRADMTFPLGVVAASSDPVALDAWAWRIIEAERARRNLPTLDKAGRPPRYIATAAAYGLGVGDPEAVQEVRA
jgi:uncharacterized protein (DUF362 family)